MPLGRRWLKASAAAQPRTDGDRLQRRRDRHGGPAHLRYFFTEVPDAPTSAAYGAFHGLELLYVFGLLDIRGYAPTAFERVLATGMQRYWGSLAANGVPVAAGAAAWTRYDPTRDNFLNLDSAALAMGEGVNSDRCDFWSTLGV